MSRFSGWAAVLSLVACGAEAASLQLFRGDGVVDCDTDGSPETWTISATADFSSPRVCVTDSEGKHWQANCEGSGRPSDSKIHFFQTDNYLCGADTMDALGYDFSFEVRHADFGKLAAGECVTTMAGEFWKFDGSTNMKFPDCVAYNANTFLGANPDTAPTKLPGLEFLGMGVNIMTDELTGNAIRSVNKPHVMRLSNYDTVVPFDSSWSTGTAWFKAANTQVINSRTAVDSSVTTNFQDTRSVQNAKAVNADVGGSYGIATASTSMKVSSTYEASFSASKVRSEREFVQGRYKLQLKNDQGMFSRQFLYRIWKAYRDYPTGDDPVLGEPYWVNQMATALVAEFGTHIITEVEMGGRVTVIVETSKCMSAEARTTAVEGQVCGGVAAPTQSANACAGGENSDTTSSQTVNGVESWSVEVEGGSRSVCTKQTCVMDTFAATVNEPSAEIIKVKLSELTSFLDLLKPIRIPGSEITLEMDSYKINLLKTALGRIIEANVKPNVVVKACASGIPVSGAISIGPSVAMLMMTAVAPIFALLCL